MAVSVFPRPGRPVEEDATLQMTARVLQPLALRGEAHRAALDAVEQAIGQHDAGAGNLGKAMELDVERLRLVPLERHRVAPVDVAAARDGTQLAQEALGSGPLAGHHLHPDLAPPRHL